MILAIKLAIVVINNLNRLSFASLKNFKCFASRTITTNVFAVSRTGVFILPEELVKYKQRILELYWTF